jgi:hypothetical protein
MQRVEIRVNRSALADILGSMREWLDHRKVELAMFHSALHDDTVIIHAEFPHPEEAAAFGQRFGAAFVSTG